MSTDGVVPERWREHYGAYKQLPKWTDSEGRPIQPYMVANQLIEELGTAESLVRDLARELQEATLRIRINSGHSHHFDSFLYDAALLLSRVPAHLRAPETTSTGESSQEDLK